jgi:hypothetical protein
MLLGWSSLLYFKFILFPQLSAQQTGRLMPGPRFAITVVLQLAAVALLVLSLSKKQPLLAAVSIFSTGCIAFALMLSALIAWSSVRQ